MRVVVIVVVVVVWVMASKRVIVVVIETVGVVLSVSGEVVVPVVRIVHQGVSEMGNEFIHFSVSLDTISKCASLDDLSNLFDSHETGEIFYIVDLDQSSEEVEFR